MKTRPRRQVCVLLPNREHLDCTVGVRSRGREVLISVLKHLGISDLQVLALALLRDNEFLFLDLEQKLSKYFGKRWSRGSSMLQFILFLRVKFYPESGLLILSSRVQQLYFSALRQKVLQSQSRHQEVLFFTLAASALQAELGDLELREEGDGEERKHERELYFLPEDYFPSWLIKRRGRDFLLKHGPALHRELRGLTPRQAILQFIKEANRLQDVNVTSYRMRLEKNQLRSSIILALTLTGVQIHQEVEGKLCLLHDLSWTHIDRLTFQGSRFQISAVGSLCLPLLQFFTPSAFHSKHVLKHLRDSHRFHISTRDSLSYIQQLEDMQASQLYKEAYICDTTRLKHKLQRFSSLGSSTTDCSLVTEATAAWTVKEEEEEEEFSYTEFEQSVDEPEEFLVDDPAEVSWQAELISRAPAGDSALFPSSDWEALTVEMMQVLRRRDDAGVSVD